MIRFLYEKEVSLSILYVPYWLIFLNDHASKDIKTATPRRKLKRPFEKVLFFFSSWLIVACNWQVFLDFLFFAWIPQIFHRFDNEKQCRRYKNKLKDAFLDEILMSINSFHRLSWVKKKIESRLEEKKKYFSRLCNCLSSNAYLRYFRFCRCVEQQHWHNPRAILFAISISFLFQICSLFLFANVSKFRRRKKMPPKKLNPTILNKIIFADCRILSDTCRWEKLVKNIGKKTANTAHSRRLKNNSFDCKWVKLFSSIKIRRN